MSYYEFMWRSGELRRGVVALPVVAALAATSAAARDQALTLPAAVDVALERPEAVDLLLMQLGLTLSPAEVTRLERAASEGDAAMVRSMLAAAPELPRDNTTGTQARASTQAVAGASGITMALLGAVDVGAAVIAGQGDDNDNAAPPGCARTHASATEFLF